MKRLRDLRARIDALDRRIVAALHERAALAADVGRAKTAAGVGLYHPAREAEVLRSLAAIPGPFPAESLRAIYREVIGASLALEGPVRVAVLGPPATFTHQAALRHFGHAARYLPVATIADVFEEVEKGRETFGVVPIENALEGAVIHTLDLLVESDLRIAAEIHLPVRQALLARRPATRPRRIVSHPQALAQCRAFLEERFPRVPTVEVQSTARAAEIAARDARSWAIASRLAAEVYRLHVVEDRIEDRAGNVTRFLVLARPEAAASGRTGRDKTSIAFSLRDRPGALARMLRPFERRGVNLTKIESRPARVRAWRYVFFVDMDGHVEDRRVAAAIRDVERSSLFFRHLGSYPADG